MAKPEHRLACAVAGLLFGMAALAQAAEPPPEDPVDLMRRGIPLERPQDPPLAPPAKAAKPSRSQRSASTIVYGRFTSIQVNVNGIGADILGDAANEPSIAVHPLDHNKMVIGWRQFDNVASNFRQAGVGYTTNGGTTWTAGKLDPGVFRSDPVLGVDSGGNIFYNSLTSALNSWIFRSYDGGATWQPPVFANGGDKQWMAIDRDLDNVYQAWSTASNPYAPNTFNKSVDDGDSYSPPSAIPNSPVWGTLATANDHRLYVVGWGGGSTGTDLWVGRSDYASNHDWDPPAFTMVPVNLGGGMRTGAPNPAGLLGQLWIAVDRSPARDGFVYVLGSVQTVTDPLDVEFIRSIDRGQTWSAPVRVNDDLLGNGAYQWFGTMSVSPSGRIDAVWNDSRVSADSTWSALFYSYSTDAGKTWSVNEQMTPVWKSTVGWPNQQKIGDYYTMVSDNTGADLAYAATFNGGQDVYYVRIPNNAAQTGVGDQVLAQASRFDFSPNPFSGPAAIHFDVPASGAWTRLEVFDIAGHRRAKLIDGVRAGPQALTWDGRGKGGEALPAGIYFCRLRIGGRTETLKLLRVR